jgi:uncharacterized protein (TIGR01440 family)
MIETIKQQAQTITTELVDIAKLQKNSILVVGCSSSEIAGHAIGSYSSKELADAVFAGIYPVLKEKGIYLAAQCCEHLNRALIIEKECMEYYHFEQVNVIPQPKAGGSFATAAYENLHNPIAVEFIKADAGIDIGGTLIGMHLKHVAVPVRLSINKIGEANVICARTRAKYIGGNRACYNEDLM